MLPAWVILATSLGYLLALFALAWYGDRRASDPAGQYLVSNPYVFSLSIAIYCTSWTYYGSVGRAATSGFGFLPIYLGPTIVFTLGWFVLRKILRICKTQRITSIADFISSRYGKSQLIGSLVTVIAVVGIVPYIALQLKAVSMSFGVVLAKDHDALASTLTPDNMAFAVTLVLAAFAVLFGTRHIEATEHHAGMVVAIAAESVVKVVAFLAVGAFVVWGLYDGFGDIFARAAADPEIARLVSMEKSAGNWATLTLLSMAAIICTARSSRRGVGIMKVAPFMCRLNTLPSAPSCFMKSNTVRLSCRASGLVKRAKSVSGSLSLKLLQRRSLYLAG